MKQKRAYVKCELTLYSYGVFMNDVIGASGTGGPTTIEGEGFPYQW